MVVNGSGSSVSNTISIYHQCGVYLDHMYVLTTTNTYSVSTCIDGSLAIIGSILRDVLHMIHINNYFPNICIFNDSELHWILNTLCTEQLLHMHILAVNTQCCIFNIGLLVQLCLYFVFVIVYSYEYEIKNNNV